MSKRKLDEDAQASARPTKRNRKGCKFQGCKKWAQGTTKLCVKHGGGHRCEFQGCKKLARRITKFCIKHGGGHRCSFQGCTKAARGTTKFCSKHGGGHRCEFPECKKAAAGKTKFCVAHGGGNICEFPECKKSARGKTKFCISHNGGHRCEYPECKKSAQGKTKFCIAHGGGKICEFPECTKSARGKFCVAHGGGFRCQSCGLFGSATKNFTCSYCSKPQKRDRDEQLVVDLLTKEIKEPIVSHDKAAGGNLCLKYRPDILYLPNGGQWAVIIEVDEHQHPAPTYDTYCELWRMVAIMWTLGVPTKFIRYNPDAFKVSGVTKPTGKVERHAKLVESVAKSLATPPDKQLQIEWLFYDDPTRLQVEHPDWESALVEYMKDGPPKT